MKFARVGLIVLLAAGVASVVLALDIVQLPDDTFFQRELNNTGHTVNGGPKVSHVAE